MTNTQRLPSGGLPGAYEALYGGSQGNAVETDSTAIGQRNHVKADASGAGLSREATKPSAFAKYQAGQGPAGTTMRLPKASGELSALLGGQPCDVQVLVAPPEVHEAKAQVIDRLRALPDAELEPLLVAIYGVKAGRRPHETLLQYRERILALLQRPSVEVVERARLTATDGTVAYGAFSKDTGTVYLRADVLSNPSLLARTMTEELGHALDDGLGGADAPGDEGERLSYALLHADTLPRLYGAASFDDAVAAVQRFVARVGTDDDHHTVPGATGQGLDVEFSAEPVSRPDIGAPRQRLLSEMVASAGAQGFAIAPQVLDYLRDPQAYQRLHPDQLGNVREKLTALIKDHPAIAGQVGTYLAAIRDNLAASRAQLDAAFGATGLSSAEAPYRSVLDMFERSIVDTWLAQDSLLLQALIAAHPQSPAAVDAVSWAQRLQRTFAQVVVSDPGSSASAIAGFDQWLSGNEELRGRLADKEKQYGRPVSTVAMSLYQPGTAAVMSLNIYVFKDGATFKAYNPLDGRIYSGQSVDAALAELGRTCQMADGEIFYRDSQGITRDCAIRAPVNTVMSDIGMGLLGMLGGLLLVVPEPTTLTKWGGAGCISLSASYFMSKGLQKLMDQMQHESLDIASPDTQGALYDIVLGGFTVVGGAGALAGSMARSESVVASSVQALNRLVSSTGYQLAQGGFMAYGVEQAGLGLADVWKNGNLSDREKLSTTAQVVAFMAVPIALCKVFTMHGGEAARAKFLQGRSSGGAGTGLSTEEQKALATSYQDALGKLQQIAKSRYSKVDPSGAQWAQRLIAEAEDFFRAANPQSPELALTKQLKRDFGPSGKAVKLPFLSTFMKGEQGIEPKAGLARIQELRGELGIGAKKNIAYAEFTLDGQAGNKVAVSGKHDAAAYGGRATTTPAPEDCVIPRLKYADYDYSQDTEFKILQDLASRLKPTSTGTINLFSERHPCLFCTNIIEQFRHMFPGIKLNVTYGPS